MFLRAYALAGVLTLVLTGLAKADSVSERPDSVSITGYRVDSRDSDYWEDYEEGLDWHDGLVMVTEVRTVDIPVGRGRISFRGVAEGIIPQTAAVEGLPVGMIERNHDYDLLNPASLIAKSIGKPVRLVRTNRISGEVTEERAVVRSGPRGVVLDYGDGRVEAVGCSGWPERLVFDEAPLGLADKPTLSIVTNTPEAGRHQLRLSYLAFGVKWATDYVARIQPDGKHLDLTAWITLANRSGTSFSKATTQVVAGRVARDDDTEPPEPILPYRSPSCWQMDTTTKVVASVPPPPAAPVPGFDGTVDLLVVTAQKREEDIQDVPIAVSAIVGDLADYKLYTLPEPTTVAARQTKQVMMFERSDVPFERLYAFVLASEYYAEEAGNPSATGITLRLLNTAEKGLGLALPTGRVAVMAPYRDATLLAGEGDLYDAPVGLPVDMYVGYTMDVRVVETELRKWDVTRLDDDYVRREYEVEVINGKSEPVTVELRLDMDERTLVSSSRPHGRRYGDLTWTFHLTPGERQTMNFADERDW